MSGEPPLDNRSGAYLANQCRVKAKVLEFSVSVGEQSSNSRLLCSFYRSNKAGLSVLSTFTLF